MSLTIDPDTIRVSRHAVERYVQRRNCSADEAERSIRELLRRAKVSSQVYVRAGHNGAARRARVGDLVFVLTADLGAVITMYPQRRKNRRRRYDTTEVHN